MREIIRSFEEFKARADLSKPLHHSGAIIAKGGFIQRLVFRIYGVDKDCGHVLIYEVQKPSPFADAKQLQSDVSATTPLCNYIGLILYCDRFTMTSGYGKR